MEKDSLNIYKTARTFAGFTQKRAAEALNLSVDSIRLYEAGKIVPQDDIVIKMVQIYNAQFLAYQHLLYSSEIARSSLPSIRVKDLHHAVLHLQKEISDYLKCQDELINIIDDDKITDEERPRYDAIRKEVKDIIAAALALEYTEA